MKKTTVNYCSNQQNCNRTDFASVNQKKIRIWQEVTLLWRH